LQDSSSLSMMTLRSLDDIQELQNRLTSPEKSMVVAKASLRVMSRISLVWTLYLN
jgi:hypothetical protein